MRLAQSLCPAPFPGVGQQGVCAFLLVGAPVDECVSREPAPLACPKPCTQLKCDCRFNLFCHYFLSGVCFIFGLVCQPLYQEIKGPEGGRKGRGQDCKGHCKGPSHTSAGGGLLRGPLLPLPLVSSSYISCGPPFLLLGVIRSCQQGPPRRQAETCSTSGSGKGFGSRGLLAKPWRAVLFCRH